MAQQTSRRAAPALADDFKTINGKEYKNVKISRVEPDGIVITFSRGVVKIPFSELSPEIQKKYGYDPQAAAAYAAEENAKQGAVAQQGNADDRQSDAGSMHSGDLAKGAESRLGETLEQCVQRYGPLIRRQGNPDNPQFIFEKDGVTIGINFLDGKAGQISYSRPGGVPFLDLEVQQLLEVNSGGFSWQYDEAGSHRVRSSAYSKRECFKRVDGGAFAEHLVIAQIGTHFVNITSADYNKAVSAKQLQRF
jgi:hypothetical protein